MSNVNSALDASVLVLNKLFMAVHVISVRRAFCLLCKDLAEVVNQEDGQFTTYDFHSWREVSEYRAKHFRREEDDWVRTSTSQIQVPRVIRLYGYEKMPKHTVKFNRRNIFARDNNQCQYCGRKFSDHRIESGPCDAAQSRGPKHVGKHRVRLRQLQRAQRGPDAQAGPHEPDSQAGKAEAKPAA